MKRAGFNSRFRAIFSPTHSALISNHSVMMSYIGNTHIISLLKMFLCSQQRENGKDPTGREALWYCSQHRENGNDPTGRETLWYKAGLYIHWTRWEAISAPVFSVQINLPSIRSLFICRENKYLRRTGEKHSSLMTICLYSLRLNHAYECIWVQCGVHLCI